MTRIGQNLEVEELKDALNRQVEVIKLLKKIMKHYGHDEFLKHRTGLENFGLYARNIELQIDKLERGE